MRKMLQFGLLGIGLWASMAPAQAVPSYSVERLSLFMHDGAHVGEDRQIPDVANSFAARGLSAAFTPSLDANGDKQWQWVVGNTSGQTQNNLRFTAFVDLDISAEENTFFNGYGQLQNLQAPSAAHIAPDRWEVDEPGYVHGNLLQRASTGALRNLSTQSASSTDDTAMALSLSVPQLGANQQVTITAHLRANSAQGLWHRDAHDQGGRAFALYAQVAARASSTDYSVGFSANQSVAVGDGVRYHVYVRNLGSANGTGVTVNHAVPSNLSAASVAWTCQATGGASCPNPANGRGSLANVAALLPVGGMLDFEITADAQTAGTQNASASVAPTHSDTTDTVAANNTSTWSLGVASQGGGLPGDASLHPIPTLSLLTMVITAMALFGLAGIGSRMRRPTQRALYSVFPALVLALGLITAAPTAQAVFLNGDFERGSFDEWTEIQGWNPGLSGSPPFTSTNINISGSGVRLLSLTERIFDPRAPHLVLPRQGNYSAKVNDEWSGAHINGIAQKDRITEADRDPVDGKLHVRFTYAAVLQDPGHSPESQPYFHVQLLDLSTNTKLYDDFAYSNQPGRLFYSTVIAGSMWRATSYIDVDMVVPDSSLGHELEVRVLAADCSRNAHAGYVYVDAFGSGAIAPQGSCIGDLQTRGKPGAIQLTWGDTGAAGYRIYRAPALVGPYAPVAQTTSRHATWLDRGVQTGVTYYYSVRPLDSAGMETCTSGEAMGVAPPAWRVEQPNNRPPYFVSQPVKTGDVAALYTYLPEACDADADGLSFSLLAAPQGMTVDSSTGALSWQPTFAGDYRVNLMVTDSAGNRANQAYGVRVTNSNLAPTITNAVPARIPANVAFYHQIQATDPENQPLIYSLASQADGMSISASGAISWSAPQPGRYPLSLAVYDPAGASDRQQLVLVVDSVPQFSSTPVVSATVGQAYSYTAQARDIDGDTLSYALAQAPSGMAINATTGEITWLPTAEQTAIVKVSATDPYNNAATQNYQIVVRTQANRAPVITSTAVTYAVASADYHYQATATDADGDHLTWRIISAPAGVEIEEATGVVEWHNPTVGQHSLRIEADDRRGGQTQQSYTLNIAPAGNRNPVITSSAPSITLGQAWEYAVVATDADGDAISYTLASAPAGMVINGSTGLVQWAMPTTGSHQFSIKASDPHGAYAQQDLQFNVITPNTPPTISSNPAILGTVGTAYSYQVVATDAQGDTLSYSLSQAPAGMVINASNGLLTWPSPTLGAHAVAVAVSDGQDTTTQSYTLTVSTIVIPNTPPTISSNPAILGTVGTAYSYQVVATDAQGDTLSYSLSQAPAGMVINASNGLLTWPSPTLGAHAVAVAVSDGQDTTTQSYTLTVSTIVIPNTPPAISSSPATVGTVGTAYSYQVVATDAQGDTLSYSLSQAPAGMVINATSGLLTWANPTLGAHAVAVSVSDGQATTTQSYTLTISAASQALDFTLSGQASPQHADSGAATTLQAFPEGGTAPYQLLSFKVDGQNQAANALHQVVITNAAIGKHSVDIEMQDRQGVRQSTQLWFSVKDPSDNTPPVAQISAPGDSQQTEVADITAAVSIIGTASDAQFGDYVLLISAAGKGQWSELVRSQTPVINGELGQLDPSSLANGLYDIGLIVTDSSGHKSSAMITVALEGQNKPGAFSISFEDMALEVLNLPVTVNRTYDSLRRNESLDFGYGWSADYQDVKVQTNGVPGRDWELRQLGSGFSRRFCAQPLGSRVATVRLPGGKLERFDIKASPECYSWTDMSAQPFFSIQFIAKAGTTSQLESTDAGQMRVTSGALFDYDSLEPSNPQKYKLTTREGSIYYLDKSWGIEQIQDRDGNLLRYSASGITHSDGWALHFSRDAQGRITQIEGPNQSQRTYQYNAQGDLIAGTDQSGGQIHFSYTSGHRLNSYSDPLGKVLLQTQYNAQGQVISQTDANGNSVTLTHDSTHQLEQISNRHTNKIYAKTLGAGTFFND